MVFQKEVTRSAAPEGFNSEAKTGVRGSYFHWNSFSAAAKQGLAVQCAKKGELLLALRNGREIVAQFPDEVLSHVRAKEGLQRLHSVRMGKVSG